MDRLRYRPLIRFEPPRDAPEVPPDPQPGPSTPLGSLFLARRAEHLALKRRARGARLGRRKPS